MSKKYIELKRYYEAGLWNKKRLQNAVAKGWITQEEYEMIVNPAQDTAAPAQDAAAEQPEKPASIESGGADAETEKKEDEKTEENTESTETSTAGGAQ